MSVAGTLRTSVTDPIRVDLLPLDLPGKIGLTFAPGKHAVSKGGLRWRRDLAMDLDRLVEEYHTDILVCLLEDHELEWLSTPDLVAQAEGRGIEVHRLPIPDGGVLPSSRAAATTVDYIVERAGEGNNVIVHCAGGLGRTGTIAGCVMVRMGIPPGEAIEILHAVRGPRCPENVRQEGFIALFDQEGGS